MADSKVNVLILPSVGLPSSFLKEISELDSRLSVKDGTLQSAAEFRKAGKKGLLVERLEKAVKESGEAGSQPSENLDTMLGEAEVIFGTSVFPDNLIVRAPKLKWFHIGTPGLDRYLQSGIFDRGIMVTSGRGTTAISFAEHAIAMIFMLARNAPKFMHNKELARWEQVESLELRGKTVGIVGMGAKGTEVGRIARGIGMKVIGTSRSAKNSDTGQFPFDKTYARADLSRLLAESDFVVMAVPPTAETQGMVGAKEIECMKRGSFIVNIARAQSADQPALLKALESGRIAGAGMDVFDTEPLPPESPLWKMPNVILTPHQAAMSDKRNERILSLFCENLRRYLAGAELLNVVDKQKGY